MHIRNDTSYAEVQRRVVVSDLFFETAPQLKIHNLACAIVEGN
jgi:hypothetical protein